MGDNSIHNETAGSLDIYQSPLASRYASQEMSYLFSPMYKYSTWRRLWVALAKGQKAIGLPITSKQIASLEANLENIDFSTVKAYEKEFRHDVMAHIHAFAKTSPEAKSILHLGATSAFITDNTDTIQMAEGLKILKAKWVTLLDLLAKLAKKNASLPTLGYTHLQPAQPTTVGKRICLWLQDFHIDFIDLIHVQETLRFLGLKGATGTQASLLTLLDQDPMKAEKLDELIAAEMGFNKIFKISGQTYTRKQDERVFSLLQRFASSAHKCATDLRLLAHFGEMEEGFGEKQVGSSAMPHKRNPIRCERICGLARFLIALGDNGHYTLATQWLERSLDDSANRRIVIPEIFLSADALMHLLHDVFSNICIYPQVIGRNLEKEIPFLALENILMLAVKKGKDRQEIHEMLRKKSQAAIKELQQGNKEHLFDEIAKDRNIGLSTKEILECASSNKLIGMAEMQVNDFLEKEITPILETYHDLKAPIVALEI